LISFESLFISTKALDYNDVPIENPFIFRFANNTVSTRDTFTIDWYWGKSNIPFDGFTFTDQDNVTLFSYGYDGITHNTDFSPNNFTMNFTALSNEKSVKTFDIQYYILYAPFVYDIGYIDITWRPMVTAFSLIEIPTYTYIIIIIIGIIGIGFWLYSYNTGCDNYKNRTKPKCSVEWKDVLEYESLSPQQRMELMRKKEAEKYLFGEKK